MATLYWYGDSGNWSDYTNHWSYNSGNSPSAPASAAPTSSDDIRFDANSFTTSGQVVTVDGTAYHKDMDWTGALYNPTLTIGNLEIATSGNITFISDMTINATSWGWYLTLTSTGTQTLTTAGRTSNRLIVLFSAASNLSLQDDLVCGLVDFSRGSITTNNHNISAVSANADWGIWIRGTIAKTMTLGSSVITTSKWNYEASGLTLEEGTSTINCSGNFNGNGETYNIVNLTGATSTISGSNTFAELNLDDTKTQTITFEDGTTQTITSNPDLSGSLGHIHTLKGSRTGTGGVWDNAAYSYRRSITVSASDVPSTQDNFPHLLLISSAAGKNTADITSIFDKIGSNYKKMAIYDMNGNQRYAEIATWDTVNEIGEIWVHTLQSSETDNVFYIYYDPTAADNDTYIGVTGSTPAKAVWDSNYVFVSHMNDNEDGTGILDSTSNANHGTKGAGTAAPTEVTGLVGKAQSFDGVDDSILSTTPQALRITSQLTIEGLLNPSRLVDTAGISDGVITHGGLSVGGYALFHGDDEKYYFRLVSSGAVKQITTNAIADVGTPSIITGTYDGSVMKIYRDGTPQTSTLSFATGIDDLNVDLSLGDWNIDTNRYWGGLIDEVRISNIARSADWIALTNKSTTDVLNTWGDEEATWGISYTGGGGFWGDYLAISNSNVSATDGSTKRWNYGPNSTVSSSTGWTSRSADWIGLTNEFIEGNIFSYIIERETYLNYYPKITDVVNTSDSIITKLIWHYILSDDISLTDSTTIHKLMSLLLSDSANLNDTLSYSLLGILHKLLVTTEPYYNITIECKP